MKILIIEDESPAARRIQKMVLEIDAQIEILALLDSIESSVEWFKNNPTPDLVLMDIEIADGQSFEIFQRVEVKAPVIFTTAYDEFALKAFQVNSIDYLLKPIDKSALEKSIHKFKEMKAMYGHSTQSQELMALLKNIGKENGFRSRFLVKVGDRFFPVDISQVAYFLSEDKLSFLVTVDQKRYIIDGTLDDLEGQVDPKQFFRINRQFLASAKSIVSVHSYFNSKLKLMLFPTPKEEVLVSREKAGVFKEWMDR